MPNSELNYYLEWLIVYINCIQINFSGTDGVSLVGEVKI